VYIERLLHYKPDRRIIRHILHIGVPNGVENSMFQFGKLLTQTLVSTMGTAVIAANAVSSTLCYYQYMVGGACSAAIIAIVGRCIGAGDEPQAKYYTRTLLRFNYLSIWIIAVITVVLADPLIALYELSPQSAAISKELLLLHSIGASLIWPIGFMLPSAFRAASDVRYPMFISSLSMWAFRVAGAYVLALETVSLFGLFSFPGLGLGILGVWIAMMLDWLFRALVFLWRYVSEKWLRVHHA
jgi:Na+-driven multidrug efflux pump